MTSSGDKAELARVPENALIWNLVTSTRDNCMGAECQYYQDCFRHEGAQGSAAG
jgi:ATP-dependent DNA helicase DinG